eukprot:jgi/Psemu1/283259/fgenesh1_pg.22_\
MPHSVETETESSPVIRRSSLGLEDESDETDDQPRRFLRLPSGHLLAYGGDNGNVSCWIPRDGERDNDTESNTDTQGRFAVVQRYDDAVRCLAVSDDGRRLAVGFDTGKTQIHSFDDDDDGSDDGSDLAPHPSLGYFAGPDLGAPARDMVFLPSGGDASSYRLAVASEAGMFVIDAASREAMERSDRWLEQEARESHDQCGIRGLSVSSMNGTTVLASLAMDGRLCLWDVNAPARKLLHREDTPCVPKKDVGEIHDADAFDRSCRPVLFCRDVDGSVNENENENDTELVIGTPGKLLPCLRVFRTAATPPRVLPESAFHASDVERAHVQSIVTLLRGPGGLLVTAGRDGRVLVWREKTTGINQNQWRVVDHYRLESPATDLCLQPNRGDNTTRNETVALFLACADGGLGVVDLSKHSRQEQSSSFQHTADNTTSENTDRSKASSSSKPSDDADSVDGDQTKPASTKGAAGTMESVNHSDDDEDDDDSLADDDFVRLRLPLPRNNLANHHLVPPQPAFSPSSTPLDLTRRFLCWNHLGCVTLLQGDNQRNTIDIHFADSAFKRPISFTDNIHFILGSIGESGGIFASDTKDDDDDNTDDDDDELEGLDELNMSERTKQAVRRDRRKRSKQSSDRSKPTGSSIFFYRFETSGLVNRRNKDWHLILPDGERVLGAACGDGWAAAMTSRQFLRFFSPGGNQNQMVWLRGEPVTMVGRGRFLAVFYHETSPLPDRTQQLGYTLWDATEFRVVSRGTVSCLSKGSSLAWVGFSNDYSLMVMDTDGMLSMLITAGQDADTESLSLHWEWTPVLDTVGLRKSTDDRHWPVTVHDGKLVCIPLKGGNTYPDATRRPVTSMLGLRLPLAKSILSKSSAMEELSVRSNMALSQKKFVREVERDSEDAEDLEDEYVALCAQVDKVTLRLFSAMVDAGKLESAFDLTGRLHSEKSYDIAIRIADRQHKLADEIERAKELKFPVEDTSVCDDEDPVQNDDYRGSNKMTSRIDGVRSKQISPDSGRTPKRSLDLQPIGAGHKRSRFD